MRLIRGAYRNGLVDHVQKQKDDGLEDGEGHFDWDACDGTFDLGQTGFGVVHAQGHDLRGGRDLHVIDTDGARGLLDLSRAGGAVHPGDAIARRLGIVR